MEVTGTHLEFGQVGIMDLECLKSGRVGVGSFVKKGPGNSAGK